MPKQRILITVKTYPTLSQSHSELVCTAGLREDGTWVRIYPLPFRLLDREQQFAKWTWVELSLVRREKDQRPESHSPKDRNEITVLETIGTEDNWRQRREWALKKTKVWTNLTDLIAAGKRDELSLATFKPARLIAFESEACEEEWDPAKLKAVENQLRQKDMFEADTLRENFKPAEKIPFKFFYRFEDETGREARLGILDWEIGMLFLNCRRDAKGDNKAALEKVRQRYEKDFFTKDLHFFLGTTMEWHARGPNPWVIIGVVPFPKVRQMDLF